MTAQIPDSIVYHGLSYDLFSEPFLLFLKKRKQLGLFANGNTALQRGYRAHWLIEDNRLYLTKVDGYSKKRESLSIHYFFPDAESKQFAYWFTGNLKLPFGQLLKYVHSGYESVYENHFNLKFDEGTLVEVNSEQNTVNNASVDSDDQDTLQYLDIEKFLSH